MSTTISEYDFVDAALSQLAEKFKDIPDVKTKEGYALCKANAKEVGSYRIALEKKRVEIKKPALERCKAIDSEAKRIAEELAKIENPLVQAYKAIDEENKRIEEERKASIEARIDAMRQFEQMSMTASSEEISEWIEQVDEIDCTQGFQEYTEEALKTRNRVIEQLSNNYKAAIDREVEQKRIEEERKELEELRAAKEEAERKEREAQEIIRQEEMRKQAEELAKQRALEAEERHKIEMEEAKARAIEEERKRVEAAEMAEQERVAALEANKRHVGNIRKQSKEDFMEHCALDEEQAKAVVLAISNGLIRNIGISY